MICDQLKREHEMIMRVLEQSERFCQSTGFQNPAVRKVLLGKLLQFLDDFADGLHHDKEERILFEYFEKEAVNAHCNPVPQMQFEHDLMRSLRKQMSGELDVTKLQNLFREFKDTLSSHIMKEDQILFPLCENSIPTVFFEQIQFLYQQSDEKNLSKDLWISSQELVSELSNACLELETTA